MLLIVHKYNFEILLLHCILEEILYFLFLYDYLTNIKTKILHFIKCSAVFLSVYKVIELQQL